MNTLTTPPLSTLLPRLFADAEASQARISAIAGGARTENYLDFYSKAKDLYLAVSEETARLLYMLGRSSKAKSIVEFGTSFGISTLHLAAAVKDNGGGRVIGSEFEPGKVARARENIAAAGLSDYVDIREGDALQTLARDLPDSIDLVLLDGAKSLYPRILSLLEPKLRAGALLVADNADMCPEYLDRVRAGGSGYLNVPLGDDVELSMKL